MLSAYKHIFSFMTAERVTKLLQQIKLLHWTADPV